MASGSSSPLDRPTFATLYCQRHGIEPADFEYSVLRRTLHWHARPLRAIILYLAPGHFAADLDLIRSVADLRRMRDVPSELSAYVYHPANRGAFRRFWRVRISTGRLQSLMRETLHGAGPASQPPFAGETA